MIIIAFSWNDGKKVKYLPLAPIEAKILISRGSAHKIEADSGTMLTKKPDFSAPKLITQNQYSTTNIEYEIPQTHTLPKPVDACINAIAFSIWFFELSKYSFGA